jgi:hypothetical protein
MKVIKARVVFRADGRGRAGGPRNFTAFSGAERCLRYDYAITSESTSSHSAMPRYPLLVNPKNPAMRDAYSIKLSIHVSGP